MGNRYAITGSNGFVGAHLSAHLYKNRNILQINRDWLLDPDRLTKELKKFKPDVILHLATAGNKYQQNSDDEVFVSNVFGTYNLLRASQDIPYKAFINFSSSSVLLPEQTMYSSTKLCSEHLCEVIASKYNKPIVNTRLSSVTGRNEQSEHLIPVLIDAAKTGKEILFVEEPVHDFIDIQDLIKAVDLLIEKADEVKGKTFNISSGKSHSNKEVKEIVEKLLNKKIKTKIVRSLRSYDSTEWFVNNYDMLSLGWKPEISLKDSIKLML